MLPKTVAWKPFAVAAGALALSLAAAACGAEAKGGTPTPFSLGGSSQVTGFAPTPTAAPFKAPPAPAKPTAAGQAPATPAAGGKLAASAEAGRAVFLQAGCIGCHTIKGIPGAVGQVGPELTHAASTAAARVPGLSAAQYFRQSVLDPIAFVAPGFPPAMPPGLVQQGPQLDALIEFLLTLN